MIDRCRDRHSERRSSRATRAVTPSARRPIGALLAGLLLSAPALASCAQFPDEHPGTWREQPSLRPQAGPTPSVEGEAPPLPPDPAQQPGEPPGPCEDPDPSVVATCLGPVGALTPLPQGGGALVAERTTGRILRVNQGSEPVEIARVPVDPDGGGGLTGLALSPTYAEDQLLYAYATSGSSNEVVRIARGDSPKPVVTGIPKGSSGNAGAIADDGTGALVVATGNAGSPGSANDPGSLAGKVLRIDGLGAPAPDNPVPGSPVVSAGLSSPGGICTVPGSDSFWVTDRGGPRESLYRIQPGRPPSQAWTWQDRPGVAGCAASDKQVVVALNDASALYTLTPTPEGGFSGEPAKVMENTYGKFSAATVGSDGLFWLGTANKAGGRPGPTDDRVVRIEPPSGGAAGKD